MGLPYFNDKSWSDITRDERTFCADLYYHLKQTNNVRKFTKALLKKVKIDNIDLSGEIEMAFEVAYYRDVIFNSEYGDGENITRFANKRSIQGLLKRTFDLCIFLPNDIIIIEAKAAESLTNKQMTEFIYDKKSIKALHRDLGLNEVNVHLIGLVSGEYKYSPATEEIFKKKIITWENIEEFNVDYKMTESLKTVYSKTGKVRTAKNIDKHEVITSLEKIDLERRAELEALKNKK